VGPAVAAAGLGLGLTVVLWLVVIPPALGIDVAAELEMLAVLGAPVFGEHPTQAANASATPSLAQLRFSMSPLLTSNLQSGAATLRPSNDTFSVNDKLCGPADLPRIRYQPGSESLSRCLLVVAAARLRDWKLTFVLLARQMYLWRWNMVESLPARERRDCQQRSIRNCGS
jgi:hypothetical protein